MVRRGGFATTSRDLAGDWGKPLSWVKRFLDRGGAIAWGIVPSDEQGLAGETEASLFDRLEETMAVLSRKGIDEDLIRSRCLITPSCGLGSLSRESASRALQLTAAVSARFRERYCENN